MQTVIDQFNEIVERGIIPCFEFERVTDDNDKEWFIVDIELNDKGIVFSFDQNGLPVFFDGQIITLSENNYLVPFDECFENLHYYLEFINDNIRDGYLIANNIDVWEF